jgi:hypothetical protein
LATSKVKAVELEEAYQQADKKTCPACGGQMVAGELSSVANFGVTREPHFVTSYGWMQVKYDRATPIDSYMCLKCGLISFFGRQPLAVLSPMERQQLLMRDNPELDKKMKQESRRKKELETKGQPVSGDEHIGV